MIEITFQFFGSWALLLSTILLLISKRMGMLSLSSYLTLALPLPNFALGSRSFYASIISKSRQ